MLSKCDDHHGDLEDVERQSNQHVALAMGREPKLLRPNFVKLKCVNSSLSTRSKVTKWRCSSSTTLVEPEWLWVIPLKDYEWLKVQVLYEGQESTYSGSEDLRRWGTWLCLQPRDNEEYDGERLRWSLTVVTKDKGISQGYLRYRRTEVRSVDLTRYSGIFE